MPRLGLGSSLTGGGGVVAGYTNLSSVDVSGGIDEYVDCGTGLNTALGTSYSGDLTVAFWLYHTGGDAQAGFFTISNMGSDTGVFTIRTVSNKMALTLNTEAWKSELSPGLLSSTTWYHVVAVFDSSDYTASKLYIDGSAPSQTVTGTFPTPPLNFVTNEAAAYKTVIGTYYRPTDMSPPSLMDEVAVWNVALDTDAITAIYNSRTPFDLREDKGDYDNSNSLLGYWRFEDNANDSSGNDYHGTLTGGATISSSVPS